MKQILLVIALLLCGASAWGATFTQNASGEWQSATTWNTTPALGCHLTYPCGSDTTVPNGDIVVFKTASTVYCDSGHVCSWGTSPQNNTTSAITTPSGFTSLTICGTGAISPCSGGTGAILVYMQRTAFTNGTLIGNPGYSMFYDCTWDTTACATDAYTFEITAPAQWNLTGNTGTCPIGNTCTINLQGDASLDTSGLKNGSTTCTTDSCMAGSLGNPSGSCCVTTQGLGTFANNVVRGFSGSTFGGRAHDGISFVLVGAGIISVTGNDFGHNGFMLGWSGSGTTGTLVLSGNWIHDCKFPSSVNQGCYIDFGSSSATGTQQFVNTLLQGPEGSGNTPTATNWIRKNVMYTGSIDGAFPNTAPGIRATDSGTYDGIFEYSNQWNSGTSEASPAFMTIPTQALINSVTWAEPTAGSSEHKHAWNATLASLVGGSMVMQNNYYGSMGFSSLNGSQFGSALGGNPAGGTNVLTSSGNVTGPGYNGWASQSQNHIYLTASTANGNTLVDINNTAWSSLPSTLTATGTLQNPWGTVAGEATPANVPIPYITTFADNFFTRTDGIGVGPTPKAAESAVYTAFNNFISSGDFNAEFNMDAGSSGTDQVSSNATGWFASGPATHDLRVASHIPVLVNPWPVIPLFDVLYGFPSGFLNGGTPTTAATFWGSNGLVGAWTAGTSYTIGQIVSDSQAGGASASITNCAISAGHVATLTGSNTFALGNVVNLAGFSVCTALNNGGWVVTATGNPFTVSAQSASSISSAAETATAVSQPVYGGRTTYWRSTANCGAATAFNRPVTGADDINNPFAGHVQCWEEAWIRPFEVMVLNPLGPTWSDGAINAVNLDAIHVLNAWLRKGVQPMEPLLWTGCQSGAMCGVTTPINQLLPSVAVMAN